VYGRTTPATAVDHLYPHRGNRTIFWLRQLWVSSCSNCHNSMKQSVEARGIVALDALARAIGYPTLAEVRGSGNGIPCP
jgi:cytochrome c553